MASSNTVFRPRCVNAEHSRYFTAPGEQVGRGDVTTSFQNIRKRNIARNVLEFKAYSFEATQGKWSARVYFANLNEGVSV